jgi:hypothetical protein
MLCVCFERSLVLSVCLLLGFYPGQTLVVLYLCAWFWFLSRASPCSVLPVCLFFYNFYPERNLVVFCLSIVGFYPERPLVVFCLFIVGFYQDRPLDMFCLSLYFFNFYSERPLVVFYLFIVGFYQDPPFAVLPVCLLWVSAQILHSLLFCLCLLFCFYLGRSPCFCFFTLLLLIANKWKHVSKIFFIFLLSNQYITLS